VVENEGRRAKIEYRAPPQRAILYQHRVVRAQSEVRTAILVAVASLTESKELLRKADGMLRSQLRDPSAELPMKSNQSKTI
jgi:hypothetical protein